MRLVRFVRSDLPLSLCELVPFVKTRLHLILFEAITLY